MTTSVRTNTEEILRRWCTENGCDWGRAHLVDPSWWEEYRHAQRVRGIDLLPADVVVCVRASELFDVVHAAGTEAAALRDYLQGHGLAIGSLDSCYVSIVKHARGV